MFLTLRKTLMVLKMVGKYLEKLLISEERHEGLLEIGSILVLAIF